MPKAPETEPPAQPGPERRQHPRYKFEGVLKIDWGTTVRDARVRDISAGGMEVELADPFWIGARFSAELEIGAPIRMTCEVRYVVPGHGMGVSLVIPEESERHRFEALLAQLAGSDTIAESK